jgi:hypothetical protein
MISVESSELLSLSLKKGKNADKHAKIGLSNKALYVDDAIFEKKRSF